MVGGVKMGVAAAMVTVGVAITVGVAVYYLAPTVTSISPGNQEVRGLWVATVTNMDWPTSATDSPIDQQQQLLKYLNIMQDMNMNVMFLQVRTSGDALYESDLEPWSEWLTGQQGLAPSPAWDPLKFAITEAHKRDIELHAWINPYRAALNYKTKSDLTPEHMCNRFGEYCYNFSSYMWMDPGSHDVQDHIMDVVEDIIGRYDVDGLHIDDYFYPYPVTGLEFADDDTYAEYVHGGGHLAKHDWRRDNVNQLIQRMYEEVHSRSVLFSVAPFGLYRCGEPDGMPPPLTGLDPYSSLYSDVKLWFQKGWMDMLIPLIYWGICPDSQSFVLIQDWWSEQNTAGVYLCPGLAVYKVAEPHDWEPEEICHQVKVTRSYDYRQNNTVGHVQFGANFIRDDYKNVIEKFKSIIYHNKTALPWA